MKGKEKWISVILNKDRMNKISKANEIYGTSEAYKKLVKTLNSIIGKKDI